MPTPSAPPPYQPPMTPPLPNEAVLYNPTQMQYPPNQVPYQPVVDKADTPSAPFAAYHASSPAVYHSPCSENPTTLIVTKAATPTLGRLPCNYTCPMCHYQVMTDVSLRNGTTTYLICLGLFGVGCLTSFLIIGVLFWLICCIPLFMREFKDAVHTCPNCSAHIGTTKPTFFGN